MMSLSIVYWMFLSYPITVFLTFLGTVTLTAAVYLKSLFRRRSCFPVLYYKESSLSHHILKKCKSLQAQFRPPLLLRSAHAQTFLGMCPLGMRAEVSRKYLQVFDGGIVSMDESKTVMDISNSAPVVVIVPGISGSKRTVAEVFKEALANRMRPVIFNARGQNGNEMTTAKLQDYGDPTDLREVIQYLIERYPNAKVAMVGIASGADLVMSYLGEFGSSSYVESSVVISPSYDSETVYSDNMPRLFAFLYLLFLKSTLFRYLSHFSTLLDMDKLSQTWNFKDYIQNVCCKLGGHVDCEEFWENNGPLRDVDEISTPVLCVSSLDDPLCSSDIIPFELFKSTPNLFLVTTEYGGHAGFVDSLLGTSWTAKTSLEFIRSLLEFQCEQNGHAVQ